jgi:hypothetical protein
MSAGRPLVPHSPPRDPSPACPHHRRRRPAFTASSSQIRKKRRTFTMTGRGALWRDSSCGRSRQERSSP